MASFNTWVYAAPWGELNIDAVATLKDNSVEYRYTHFVCIYDAWGYFERVLRVTCKRTELWAKLCASPNTGLNLNIFRRVNVGDDELLGMLVDYDEKVCGKVYMVISTRLSE